MSSDIEIAESTKLKSIESVAKKLGLKKKDLIFYGDKIAKINKPVGKRKGKLILVTAINPTPMGEGKTTVSIGLCDALRKTGKKVCLALREPSLGPVFGLKGGATGGGRAQIAPMIDINLHFTGDLHAITSANNLLCALINNHIYQGNELDIDENKILHRYCMDVNERALREISLGKRKSGFDITAASEIMAILCLAEDGEDLKKRLGNILVGYTKDKKPVFAKDLKAEEAMAILLKDAIKPNLAQTLEGNPAIVHGGPFANIAHGCNSVIATKQALSLADITVTEAGFGADLGAEKFLDIKCRIAGIEPDAVVLVATVRSLKFNGGGESMECLEKGMANLIRHIDNIKGKFNLPVVVALNKFNTDTEEEIEAVRKECKKQGAGFAVTEGWGKGGAGALELAAETLVAVQQPSKLKCIYNINDKIEEKIEKIAVNIYGASGVEYSAEAKEKINEINKMGKDALPVCIAKTQYSFSDDAKKLGAPSGFKIKVRDINLRSGAGFIVAECGSIMLMPGLPKVPAACNMTINGDKITGIF